MQYGNEELIQMWLYRIQKQNLYVLSADLLDSHTQRIFIQSDRLKMTIILKIQEIRNIPPLINILDGNI